MSGIPSGFVESMPNEVWDNIFRYCSVGSLVALRLVSKRFRPIITDKVCLLVGWNYTRDKLVYRTDLSGKEKLARRDYMKYICNDEELFRILTIHDEDIDIITLLHWYGTKDMLLKYVDKCPEKLISNTDPDANSVSQDVFTRTNEVLDVIYYLVSDHVKPDTDRSLTNELAVLLERLINIYGKKLFTQHIPRCICYLSHSVQRKSVVTMHALDVLHDMYPDITFRLQDYDDGIRNSEIVDHIVRLFDPPTDRQQYLSQIRGRYVRNNTYAVYRTNDRYG